MGRAPKCHHKYPYKTETEGDWTHKSRGKSYEEGGRNWSDIVTSQDMPASSHQKLGEAKNRFSPRVLEGMWPSQQVDFGLLAFRTVRG